MTARSPESRHLAFFDLDFTIVPHDTMLLFCNYVLQRHRLRLLYVCLFLPAAIPAAFGLISSGTIKRFFFSFLYRMPEDQVREYAAAFVRDIVLPAAFPEVLERIEAHRSRGDYLILNTASPYFYAEHIAQGLGFDACCATDLVLEPRQTALPRIAGRNNKHAVKLDAMLGLLPEVLHQSIRARRDFEKGLSTHEPSPLPESTAYSDSPADLPLLRLAESAVLIGPGSKLVALSPGRPWQIIRPRMPFGGPLSRLSVMVRQALGLYRIGARA